MRISRLMAVVVVTVALLAASYALVNSSAGAAADGRIGSVPVWEAMNAPADLSGPSRCMYFALSTGGQTAIETPSFCVGGLCQILLWSDMQLGAFGPGLSMPAYYTQDPADQSWIGGPSISIGSVSFSDGEGENGDGITDTIFIGGATVGGDYVRLYDDSATENSSGQWTVEYVRNGSGLNEAAFYICPLVYERYDVDTEGQVAVDVPSFCIADDCGMVVWNDAVIGAFGPGMGWPVIYYQNAADDAWADGPVVNIAGAEFGGGGGTNGNGVTETVYAGGQTVAGGYVRLYDDSGTENLSDQWTIELSPDAYLTEASFFIYPLTCEAYRIDVTGETEIDVPTFCTHGVCNVTLWSDATFGAFYPGANWPSFYSQSTVDSSWIGGPDLSIAGFSFGDGSGVNGDGIADVVYYGGQTSTGGYVHLYDDYGGETSPLRWTAVFSSDADLTWALYTVCAGSCLQVDVPVAVPRGFLPATLRDFTN